MPKILYGISPIGLGHATRSMVLAEELRRRGAEVRLFSGGKAAEFIRDSGTAVESVVEDAVPHVVDGEMSRVAIWYVRSWLAQRRNVRMVERLFDSFGPDLVVCDEEFSGLAVAGKRGRRRVFISDELLLGFARTWLARRIEGKVERWYRDLQDSVDLLLVPDFGTDTGNKKFVGPIVRARTMPCGDVRAKYGLPEGGRMVLFSMSGSGIGRDIGEKLREALRESKLGGAFMVVSGNRGPAIPGEGVYDLGLVADNHNLVACADLVVSTAGKSTIDEAASAGTPIVVIPIRHHAEQERNALALGYSHEDLRRLPDLLREKIGKRGEGQDFMGEMAASDAILSLL